MNSISVAIARRAWLAAGCMVALLHATSEACRAEAKVQVRELHSFQSGNDGAYPGVGLTADAKGALYGTTPNGGSNQCANDLGCGTVFRLTPSQHGYVYSIIYNFPQTGNSPAYPSSPVIADATGALYGTSGFFPPISGQCVDTFFRLAPTTSGFAFSLLYCFKTTDTTPHSSLIVDSAGAFYGTGYGPNGTMGAVFKLTPGKRGYTERVLYNFKGGNDGADPVAGLYMDATGALFGTTRNGGGFDCPQGGGCGVAFKLTPKGKGYSERVIHRFQGGSDGDQPMAPLVADVAGDLFGTTNLGGSAGSEGCGTVFKLAPSGSKYAETILYNFSKCNSFGLSHPVAPVTIGANAVLYGTTPVGGGHTLGEGGVFALTPTGSTYVERDLHLFVGSPNDGSYPLAGLLNGSGGVLFGTTQTRRLLAGLRERDRLWNRLRTPPLSSSQTGGRYRVPVGRLCGP